MALSDVGDFQDAARHLTTALELDPELTNARVALGVQLAKASGKTQHAIYK
jgi:hypothetical protein